MFSNNSLNIQNPNQMEWISKLAQETELLSEDLSNPMQISHKKYSEEFISFISKFNENELSAKQLERWLKNFIFIEEEDRFKTELELIAKKCNKKLTGLTALSPPKLIVKAIQDCILAVEQSNLPEGKYHLEWIIAAGVADRCHFPIPMFKKNEYISALGNEESLYNYLCQILRKSIYSPSGIFFHAIDHEGYNSTYVDSQGKKVVVQWHNLYENI